MKKALIAAISILLILPLGVSVTEADVVDQIGGLIAKAPYIISPTNTTYTPGALALNVSFQAAMYGNLNYTVTYSVDDAGNETMPLVAHYFGFQQQEKNYLDGSIVLPQLNSGSHKVSVYVECYMFSNWNESSYFSSKSFYDNQAVYFTILGNTPPSSSPSPTQQPTTEPTQTLNSITDNVSSANFTQATILGGTAAVAVAVGGLIYLKKRKGS